MKRKDDAEERKQTEQVLQKSIERIHWTTSDSNSTCSHLDAPMNGTKLQFAVEYDNSASGINTVVSGSTNSTVGRVQFGKKAVEADKREETEPQISKHKMPKLK